MADCGCRPCSKELPKQNGSCKPFSLCVGNNSLHYDGECLFVTKRKFQIPDGSYTSLTFKDGCIVDVGQAPIPVYTPQACCDGAPATTVIEQPRLEVAEGAGNLAKIEGNKLTVDPLWRDTTSVNISGNGTTDKPWKAEVVVHPRFNRIEQTNQGLRVELELADSDHIRVEGAGTHDNPYKFNIAKVPFTLPEINKKEVLGNGFKITREGLWEAKEGLDVVTNLRFSSDAFQVINTGMTTQVIVDEARFANTNVANKTAVFIGNGQPATPLDIDDEALLNRVLSKPSLVFKLKQALGV